MENELEQTPTGNATATGGDQGKGDGKGTGTATPSALELAEAHFSAADKYAQEPADANKAAMEEASKKAKEAVVAERTKAAADAKAKADADAKAKAEAEKGKGAPAVVSADKLKLPEKSLLPPSRLAEIAKIASEKNITLDQAQAQVESESKLLESFVTGRQDLMKKQEADWVAEIQKDPVIGGENTKKVDELLTRGINKFFPTGFLEKLQGSGFSKNPDLVKGLYGIFSKMADPELQTGSPAAIKREGLKEHELIYGPDSEYDPLKVAAEAGKPTNP